MPERNYRKSWAGRDAGRRQSAQEAFSTREQAGRSVAGPEIGTLTKEKCTKSTITLEDSSVVDAVKAVCAWDLLKDFQHEEPALFQSLLALAQGRPADADPRHLKILKGLYVNEDRTVESVTRAVLLNSLSMADGTPMVAALRLKSAADRAVFEETQAQVYQNIKESEARAVSPGGWFDQFMKRLDQGKGPSRS